MPKSDIDSNLNSKRMNIDLRRSILEAYVISLALPTRSFSSRGLYSTVELELCCRKEGGGSSEHTRDSLPELKLNRLDSASGA